MPDHHPICPSCQTPVEQFEISFPTETTIGADGHALYSIHAGQRCYVKCHGMEWEWRGPIELCAEMYQFARPIHRVPPRWYTFAPPRGEMTIRFLPSEGPIVLRSRRPRPVLLPRDQRGPPRRPRPVLLPRDQRGRCPF